MTQQSRLPSVALVLVVSVAALTGCTAQAPAASTPAPLVGTPSTPTPQSTLSAPSSNRLPSCDAITDAVSAAHPDVLAGLAYDRSTSESNTAAEAYDQRVCVFTSPDGATELGITIAKIPFQQPELDNYATLPNALDDPRLAVHDAVLQTFSAGDGDDGHLDSPLYLIDTEYSITIQGMSANGDSATTLPALTVPAAIDMAFVTRGLIG
ncbi:hypothetical protein IWX81_000290 [Salinibacterium sp. CAN_S4]|uniref:hypothetical protein n=1 Tax=Salinibacterium sp. CAN_S4 TaxID=2787727 RepID=UPI0018F01A48